MVSDARTEAVEEAGERSQGRFSTGCNCAESVMESVGEALSLGTALVPRAAGYAWTGGIDQSGCLCGALSAAVSLAGLVAEVEGGSQAEQRARARSLADEVRQGFVEQWRGTCCRVVRAGRQYDTPECAAHCREVTSFTTRLALDLYTRDRELRPWGWHRVTRGAAAVGVGALVGIEAAWALVLVGLPSLAWMALIGGLVGGVAWAVAILLSRRARHALARPGRVSAAAGAVAAAVIAALEALEVTHPAALADALGFGGTWPRAAWVVSLLTFALPMVFDLVRRRGAA